VRLGAEQTWPRRHRADRIGSDDRLDERNGGVVCVGRRQPEGATKPGFFSNFVSLTGNICRTLLAWSPLIPATSAIYSDLAEVESGGGAAGPGRGKDCSNA
jgi:hypothetical protein